MIMNIDTTLCIAGALPGLMGLIAALRAGREARRLRARCESLESSLAALRRESELAASISMKTGRRVQRIEQEFSIVAERVDVVELRGAAQSFDQAIDSARRGADPGKLAQQFGLSRGEAELVTRLHGRKRGGQGA
jgi:phage shock protein A